MTLHSSELDDESVAYKAFLTIQRDFYESPARNIPEFLPFKKPKKFDINKSNYESPVLSMIIDAVRHVSREILQKQNPGKYIYDMNLSPEELERISWKVFALLRLAPLRDKNDEGKTVAQYYPERYPDNFGEKGHIDMTHNRILAFEKKGAQEQVDRLQNALMDILNKRYKYLEELFSTQEPQEKERIMAHIERCMQEIHPIQRDIHSLCHQFQLPNQLLPVEEEGSSLSQIVHWNYIQRQERARAEFDLSESEKALLPFVPSSFPETEWPLFHFTFVPSEEIEEHNWDESGVFRKDILLLRERLLERKMMIGYYILQQLALHRRNGIMLDPKHATLLTQTVGQLSIEIDLLRRKLLNKSGQANRVKYTLSEIDTLLVSMQNVLEIPRMSPALSQIMEGIMEIMHAFYSSCNAIYADKYADPLEIEGLIDALRLDTLERLRTYESQIVEAETSSPLGDDADFHRVVDIMSRALAFLEGKK